MLYTAASRRGLIAAPHHLAAQSGLAVLRQGGNAIEAMVAAAATAAVVCPHMTGLGGDGFWLIHEPGRPPVSIDGAGAAGRKVTVDLYRRQGLDAIPERGPLAANTVAGTVSGWHSALEISTSRWGGTQTLEALFADAMAYAREGVPVAPSVVRFQGRFLERLREHPGYAAQFLPKGKPLQEGQTLANPALAEVFADLARNGLDDFYRGAVARRLAADLAALGSPLVAEDFARHRSIRRRPLSLQLPGVTVFNTPPPTQGLAALILLGLAQRQPLKTADSAEHLHALIEATKIAFQIRNAQITDPLHMGVHPTTYLHDPVLDGMVKDIDPQKAAPWPQPLGMGDTVYMACADGAGRVVSFIQSLFHPFGAGVVLPETGLLWQNRGCSFSLSAKAVNTLEPGRKPFHTLAPALAKFRDGRVMAYGTMGGDGQPQTQAAVFTRYAHFGQGLQQAISAPRWVLGKSYGEGRANSQPHDLKVESRFDPDVLRSLQRLGHEVAILGPFEDIMGHASAVVAHADGRLDGACDPRGDGCVAAF